MNTRKRAIDLQLVKPVTGTLKGKITLVNLQKELLTALNVPYADLCCVGGDIIPQGAPVRYEGGNLQYLDVTTDTWTTIVLGGAAARFGVSGEDDIAAETRFFDLDGNDLEISTDSSNSGLFLTNSSATQRTVLLQTSDPDLLGTTAIVDVRSVNGGNFSIDIYAQNDDGSQWGEVFLVNNSLYIAHSDEIDIETGSQDIFIRLIEGQGIDIQVQSGQTILLNGIDQDDTAPMILALDNTQAVRWVDPTALVGNLPIPTIVTLNAPFGSTDGGSGGGAIFYSITGLSTVLDASSRYEIEAQIVFNDNSAGGPEEFLLNFSTAPLSGQITYEILGLTGTTNSTSATFGSWFSGSDWTTHFVPGYPGAVIEGTIGSFAVRIKGVVNTDAAATTIQAQAGLFSSLGAWQADRGSYLKVTKIA